VLSLRLRLLTFLILAPDIGGQLQDPAALPRGKSLWDPLDRNL